MYSKEQKGHSFQSAARAFGCHIHMLTRIAVIGFRIILFVLLIIHTLRPFLPVSPQSLHPVATAAGPKEPTSFFPGSIRILLATSLFLAHHSLYKYGQVWVWQCTARTAFFGVAWLDGRTIHNRAHDTHLYRGDWFQRAHLASVYHIPLEMRRPSWGHRFVKVLV